MHCVPFAITIKLRVMNHAGVDNEVEACEGDGGGTKSDEVLEINLTRKLSDG